MDALSDEQAEHDLAEPLLFSGVKFKETHAH